MRTTWNTTQNMHIIQTYNKHNPKVSPFGIALVVEMANQLGDAGTTDRFDLAFQYQINNFKIYMFRLVCILKSFIFNLLCVVILFPWNEPPRWPCG